MSYRPSGLGKANPKKNSSIAQIDPYELNNLADNPKYKEKIQELRTEMDRWLDEIGDRPDLPEKELISKLWDGEKSRPVTAAPEISRTQGEVSLRCATEGASIGYKIIGERWRNSNKLGASIRNPSKLSKAKP